MNSQIPPGLYNWSKLHVSNSEEKRGVIFRDLEEKQLDLSFCFRCSLEENAADLKRYLKAVSGWDAVIQHVESDEITLFEVIGTTDQGTMDEERLVGWIEFCVKIAHDFGCWLQTWDVVDQTSA